MKRRPIATRYAVLLVALLSAALIASGALEIWSSHRDRQAITEALQREKAQSAALVVARFVEDVQRSLDWATLTAPMIAGEVMGPRRLEFLKLLRLEPAVTTVTLVDANGAEQLHVARITPDRLASGIDLSRVPGFAAARAGRTYFSDVYFAAQTEPYLTIVAPSAARDGSVVMAEVNLKFVWDVIAGIKVGATGYAYVVDAHGRLVSHPDISRVLQMTDMSMLPQVQRAAAWHQDNGGAGQGFHATARNLAGAPVLAAHAVIAPLTWTVFVDLPRAEALAPLVESIVRTVLILTVALALAVAAGIIAARRMVAPLAELRGGALRFGAGDLAHRIEVASGDELEDLATQFNEMARQLREIYADLEQRVAERTRDLNFANQAKSRFLAAASHDLRQPMHALALFVGQLETSRTPAERAALTKRIEQAVGSLSELLDQLLDLSKLDAGAVQATQQAFLIDDTLAAIETEFAPLARAKGIELRLRSTRASLRSDPVFVHRILLNLVANAIRYTRRGGVLVGCRRRGGKLRIAVWDTGCGIPDERRDDVFREFVQLDSLDQRHASGPGGLGLGLAIVTRLADLLGTRIELHSTVGRGSMFAFELPLAAQGETRPQTSAAPLSITSLRGVFVLVVDDEEAVRTGTCGLLESWGCLTLAAAGSDDAIAQLSAHDRPPELIVCDYRLEAGANGVDALLCIRRAVQDDVPAIILTAGTTAAALSAAQAIGVPLLQKPVSPVKLRALLAQLLLRASGEERAAA